MDFKDFTIRTAVESDIEKIKSYIEEFNLDSEELDCASLYVAKKNGVLAGFGRYKNYGNVYEIATIGVLKKFRNMGLGEMIVIKLINSIPAKEIWLTTIIPKYFKKFGFEKSNNIPEQIILKSRKICKKFKKPEGFSVFMQLKKF